MVASGPYQGQVDTGQGSSAPQAAPHMCKACAWWKLGPSLWPRQWGPMEEGSRGVMGWTVGAWDFRGPGTGEAVSLASHLPQALGCYYRDSLLYFYNLNI